MKKLVGLLLALALSVPAQAGGLVISHKTHKTARVAARFAAAFQAYVDDLEALGATIFFMGGYRRGRCSARHMHSCGRALDVCQVARGVVAHGQVWHGRRLPDCHLPDRAQIAAVAARHGLFEGGQWCNQDYGHAQVGVSAPPCGQQLMARRHGVRTRRAGLRGHKLRLASGGRNSAVHIR